MCLVLFQNYSTFGSNSTVDETKLPVNRSLVAASYVVLVRDAVPDSVPGAASFVVTVSNEPLISSHTSQICYVTRINSFFTLTKMAN